MVIDLILLPYDLGKHGTGMGQGPGCIVKTGVADRLRQMGHDVHQQTVTVPLDGSLTDTQLTFQLNGILSRIVAQSAKDGFFPVVLAGNCITAVGTLSGLGSRWTNVLWLDAHGDFNTPETTQSGYLDGMALSVVCGKCWRKLAANDPQYQPIPENNIFLIGTRDLDPAELEILCRSQISITTSEKLRNTDCRIPDLENIPARDLYIHFDADVIDASVGTASHFASTGGLFPDEVRSLFAWACRTHRVKALAITAYNPDFDKDGNIERVLTETLIATIETISKKGLAT
jgi:arginase